MSNKIQIREVRSLEAPQAIGPYSQALRCGDYMFMSGQIPLNPESGNIDATDIVGQTHQVMKNLAAVLESAGLNLDHVVKTTVYLSDMNNFGKFNEVYGGYLRAPFPARATVQVARLPKDALVEVEAVVYCPKS